MSASHPMPFIRAMSLPARRHAIRILLAASGLVPVLLLLAVLAAQAHDAPSGWKYPYQCCSGYDCRPVTAKTISTRPEGYVIAGTGEVVGYGDTRIRTSPDDAYHWCSVAGADDGRTICLFVPQQMY